MREDEQGAPVLPAGVHSDKSGGKRSNVNGEKEMMNGEWN